MSYTALYRKFRPGEFDEVKGQEHIVTTLRNQIKADRVGHAYLFCGTRGTGKTTVAKILAKAVNCENTIDGTPCNECEMCRKINRQVSMNVVEIDAASNNGVASIRNLIEEVQYSPTEGRYKVYIIDEAHMVTAEAFNALLKTLEEPPSYAMFILATTEPHKIPITIQSRCQRYDFRRITIDTIAMRLLELVDKEKVQVEEKALRYIAKLADVSMRDALSLLDKCIAFYMDRELTYENTLEVLGAVDTSVYSRLYGCMVEKDVTGCLKILDEILMFGRNLNNFINEFIWYLRGLMLLDASEEGSSLLDVSAEQYEQMKKEAKMVDVETLIRYIRILSELSNQIRYGTQKRVMVEITLIKLCRPQMDEKQDLTTILERMSALEKRLDEGTAVVTHTVQEPVLQAKPEEKKQLILPKALPEDIENVIRNWNKITVAFGQPGENILSYAKKVISEQGTLVLQFTDRVLEDFLIKEDGKELEKLVDVVGKIMGKEVTIETRTVEEKIDKDYGDISSLINFDGIEYQ